MATTSMWVNPRNSVKSDMKNDRVTMGHKNPSSEQFQVDHSEQAAAWREKVASGNVGRGPTVGNAEAGPKRKGFLADKMAKAPAAQAICDAIGQRAGQPDVPKTNHQKNQGQVSPNTNVGRGPRKGNQ